jgi:hypothetical protein
VGAIRLGAAALAVLACRRADSARPAQHVSADFAVEYRSLSRLPTCRGNHRVRVDSSGAVYSQTNVVDCAAGESWDAPLPPMLRRLTSDERLELERAIDASEVARMAPVTDDGLSMDGTVEEIDIRRDGMQRTIRVVNGAPAPVPFARARSVILRAAGERE